MKYKKFVTITLVTLLFCASISTVAMARNSVDETKVIGIKTVFQGKIFDFISKICNTFPILAKFFDNFQSVEPPKLEEPPKPDSDTAPPKLLFDISGKEEYKLEEPIFVRATLTNIDHEIIYVSEMNFKVGTIDFFIRTPDGFEIQFIGPVDPNNVQLLTLYPEDSSSIEIDIKCGLFGILKSATDVPSQAPIPYDFIPGAYGIYAAYRSFLPIPSPTSEFPKIWLGTLETEHYTFEITE